MGPMSPRAQKKCPEAGHLSSDRGRLCFLNKLIQVIKSLLNGKRIHFTSAIFARLDGPLQIMSRNLNRHGVGDDLAGLPVKLHPRGMRESDPYRPVHYQKLHINSVSVPCSDGDDERLILAVQL